MPEKGETSPVLFLVFNRYDEAMRSFSRIRRYKPEKLFISADGPRLSVAGEAEKCDLVRKGILNGIDWKCELQTNFSSSNRGCKITISSAISWFFENVSQGIILEDDCVPSDEFFPFLKKMLDLYSNDDRIGHIAGYNTQNGIQRGRASYYFSKYFHVWGWGTWRRAWEGYSPSLDDYSSFLEENTLENIFAQPEIRDFWKRNFDQVHSGQLDTWDYQWVYKNLKEGRLAVAPNVNLVENIGFNANGTHTTSHDDRILLNKALSMNLYSLSHPAFVVPEMKADLYTYEKHCGLAIGYKKRSNYLGKIKAIIKRIITKRFRQSPIE